MKNVVYLSCISGALIITPCFADDHEKKWQFEAAAGIEREPAYTGSDVYTSGAMLDLQASYQWSEDKALWISLGEVGIEWALSPDWAVTAALEYEPGRDNSDDPILNGFETMEDTVEGQFAVKRSWGDTYLGGVVQTDILGRGKGLVGFIAAGHEFELSPKLSVEAGVDVSFANAEHMDTEVGVSTAVSQATGISAYDTSAGYKSTTLNLDVNYDLNTRWSLVSSLGYEYYGDEMANSPLIKEHGERGNVELGLGVRYQF